MQTASLRRHDAGTGVSANAVVSKPGRFAEQPVDEAPYRGGRVTGARQDQVVGKGRVDHVTIPEGAHQDAAGGAHAGGDALESRALRGSRSSVMS